MCPAPFPWSRHRGTAVTEVAGGGATLLMPAFGPSRHRRMVEGVSQAEVEAAFPEWELLTADDADTSGLGWPRNRTSPKWYRFRRASGWRRAQRPVFQEVITGRSCSRPSVLRVAVSSRNSTPSDEGSPSQRAVSTRST